MLGLQTTVDGLCPSPCDPAISLRRLVNLRTDRASSLSLWTISSQTPAGELYVAWRSLARSCHLELPSQGLQC